MDFRNSVAKELPGVKPLGSVFFFFFSPGICWANAPILLAGTKTVCIPIIFQLFFWGGTWKMVQTD